MHPDFKVLVCFVYIENIFVCCFLFHLNLLSRESDVMLDLGLDLGAHLFVKVPRPGDSEVTFSVIESSYHLLLPV